MKTKWLAVGGLALIWAATFGATLESQTASPPDSSDSFSGLNVTLPTGELQPLSLTPGDVSALDQLSDAQLAVFLNALESTPQIPFAALPRNGRAAGYFSLQHPNYPPFPGDVNQLPVWQLNGFYLLNDLNFPYGKVARPKAASSGSRFTAKTSGPPRPAPAMATSPLWPRTRWPMCNMKS